MGKKNPRQEFVLQPILTTPLFVYGTLLIPSVQLEVIGREVNGKRAVLRGYSKTERQFSDGFYPDLVRQEGGTVRGSLLSLTSEELSRCDIYEGREYSRVLLETVCSGKAWVYISNGT